MIFLARRPNHPYECMSLDLDDIEPEIDFSTPEKAGKSSSGRRKTLVGASIADMSDSRMRISK